MSRVASGEKRTEWLDRLSRFAGSKLTVGEFCRQERVSDASFYHWRKRLSGADSSPNVRAESRGTFVPVHVSTSPTSPVTNHLEVAFPNGVRLIIGTDDRELVKMSIELAARVDSTFCGAAREGAV